MIIRTPRKQRQRSSPPPPRVDVEAMREPSMRIAVYIDMDTVGACHSLREISLRNVDIHAVAAHASPHQRAASVVTPTSTRTAALDQIFLMVGVFAGSRGGCCCGLLAAPHIIVVTRDHERGSTLKALFLYDAATRRLGATYSHASSEAEALAGVQSLGDFGSKNRVRDRHWRASATRRRGGAGSRRSAAPASTRRGSAGTASRSSRPTPRGASARGAGPAPPRRWGPRWRWRTRSPWSRCNTVSPVVKNGARPRGGSLRRSTSRASP